MRLQGAPQGPVQPNVVFKVQPAERFEVVLSQNRVHPVVYREALQFFACQPRKTSDFF